MIINFRAGSKKKRELVESIIEFSADMLMPRLKDKLEITVEFVTGLLKRDDIYGDCIWEDDSQRPKEFTIRIDAGMPLRTMLTTVAHEMVHVKQYARSELKQLGQKRFRFKQSYVSNKMDYWDLPWEIEAHGREIGLFVRWAERNGHSSKKWAQE